MTKTYGDAYHSMLWGSPAAEYLRSRGLLHSTIERFNLGYVAKPAPGHARYRGRISIPYSDGLGRERGIRYRSLPGGQDPRYLATKGFDHLFAVRASDHPVVYITEGEIDAMILWQMGLRAVAVPGTQAWKDHYRLLFRNCDEVVICFDSDEPKRDEQTGRMKPNAGQMGAVKVYRSLERLGVVTRSVMLPRGTDINEAYQLLGADGLRDILEAA